MQATLARKIAALDAAEPGAWRIVSDAAESSGPDRVVALRILGAIGSAESTALLEATLKGNDYHAIGLAAAGLTRRQCGAYLGDLERAAHPPDGQAEPAVLDGIARAGDDQAAKILIDVAESAALPASGIAFGLLGKMGRASEPLLAETVTSGRSSWSRETAAWTLLGMKDAQDVNAFRSALSDSDERVRIAAAIGLARLGDATGEAQLNAAAGGNGDLRTDAIVSLAALGRPEAIATLRGLLAGGNEASRGQTVWAIARSGSASLKDLAYRLGVDRQPVLRGMLAERLFDPADKRDAAELQEMLTNGDAVSKVIAAGRLMSTGSNAAAQALARALDSDNQGARGLALQLASGYPELRPEVAKRLASTDPAVQVAALSAIADLRRTDEFNDLAKYLTSRSPDVSASAARTLVALDPKAAKPVLRAGQTSKINYVRIYSAAMLIAADLRTTGG
ncbi:MAG TPA: HEAT repeat domain-containing protein [Bryobacteraceae bacterium]|nr:HEAT repeat domain-containing protein [Bryobacteraceae bacterium]